MKINLKERKGITLVALVITIIILLILAAISIQALTNTGLLGKTNDAKIESKMSEIEEFATLKVYELYTENINNMGAVNDATIATALKAELEAEGYKTKDANTTSETVNGLKIQDSTGQNNFDSISLLQQKNTTIKVSLDTESESISSKIYVKIYENWYELIINDKTVKVSREKHDEPVDSENKENTYEIKLTPPTSGITMTAGETPITSEITITPGALITIKAGNDIGTFAFTVKETTSSVTRNVDVKVEADPTYATDLSITVEGGEDAEVAPSKTLQLVATKTPATSTDKVSWKIKSGSATIDAAGLVTANSNAAIGSKITVSATCNREDGTTTTVGEKTFVITVQKELLKLTAQQIADDPKSYYGKEVVNYKASSSDTNTYRIFYVDEEGYFGDEANTIYLKADDSKAYNGKSYMLSTSYDSTNTKVKEMNPLWADKRGTATWNKNEKAAAYLCSPVNKTTYSNTSVPWKSYYNSEKANYVIGGPSIEMYVKSYNQAYKGIITNTTLYPLGTNYSATSKPGYIYTITRSDTLDYTRYNSMYCGKTTNGAGSKIGAWWLASPHSRDADKVCRVKSNTAGLTYNHYQSYDNDVSGISPLVSLKSTFQPQIEE